MTTTTSLEQAQTLLNTLMEQARVGAIIPVRLPAQLEEIALLLNEAKKQADQPPPPPPGGEGFDPDALKKEQAGFFGHAVHELRTPMTSIRGYSDMMANPAMGALTDMQKQFVDVIRTNGKRMETLLQDVSDMNKLRAGTLRTTLKMDMFKNIAMMIEKNMRPLAEQLNRTLTLDIPSGLPILNTDGELLAKAISKLVENALRYTKDGGQVTVRASAQGNELTIQVEDNGIGMTEAEMQQLGTVYFRSENEYVRTYKGSGLGIPVAYGIVKALGGSISVTSAVDQGTTFTIKLQGMT
ncbi:MAG: HAMP domain-containing sensor histidine kinase [bacterium]|nr:HAMP domain-containing sensor histidine kinase [bacterium]